MEILWTSNPLQKSDPKLKRCAVYCKQAAKEEERKAAARAAQPLSRTKLPFSIALSALMSYGIYDDIVQPSTNWWRVRSPSPPPQHLFPQRCMEVCKQQQCCSLNGGATPQVGLYILFAVMGVAAIYQSDDM